jgi:hypothetical protein
MTEPRRCGSNNGAKRKVRIIDIEVLKNLVKPGAQICGVALGRRRKWRA